MGLPIGVFLLVGLAAGAPHEPALRVGTATRNPPWAYVPGLDYAKDDPTKPPRLTQAQLRHLAGLDVDVMNALAGRLGARVEWVPRIWADLESGLVDRRYDVLIGSWTPSVETPETIVATTPYCDWGLLLGVRSDDASIRSYADLDGKRVGHVQDPAVERSLKAMGRGRFVAMSGEMRLLGALEARDLDAVMFDSVFARWRAAHDPSLRVVGEPLNRLGYHLGVRREDTALFDRLEAAVKALVGSGEAQAIRQRWDGPDSVPPPPSGASRGDGPPSRRGPGALAKGGRRH